MLPGGRFDAVSHSEDGVDSLLAYIGNMAMTFTRVLICWVSVTVPCVCVSKFYYGVCLALIC